MKPTRAMLSALRWLRNRGGDGVFAERNHQVLLAKGDRAPIMRSTWNRLRNAGLVEFYGPRVRVSVNGLAVRL